MGIVSTELHNRGIVSSEKHNVVLFGGIRWAAVAADGAG